MTFLRLQPRDVRALAIGATALALLIGVPRGGGAWLAWRAEALQAASEMTRELQRTKATIAGLETALDSAEVRVARFREVGAALFVVSRPAEAAAGLTAAIRDAAGVASIRIVTMESRVDTASAGVLRGVSAIVHANGDVAGLGALLQQLEARRTLLALRQLSVQPQSVETPQHAAELLDIRLTVEARALIRRAARAAETETETETETLADGQRKP